jgi:hypothetical protein
MTKDKNNSLKTASLIAGLFISMFVIFGFVFPSKADVDDTVKTEIREDNKDDDRKFFGKVEGAKLQEQVKYNGKKIDEVDDKIKDIGGQIDKLLQLSYEIKGKLNKDSI